MKLTASESLQQVKPEELGRYADIFCQDVVQVVNGGLTFGDNFNAKTLSVTFPSANGTVAVIHGLGRVPAGYMVQSLTANMVIFNGTSGNTAQTLYLQASAAGTASILVY